MLIQEITEEAGSRKQEAGSSVNESAIIITTRKLFKTRWQSTAKNAEMSDQIRFFIRLRHLTQPPAGRLLMDKCDQYEIPAMALKSLRKKG